jgi:hypothetical protein
MQIDVHHRCADGRVGALFACIERQPIRKKYNVWIEFDNELFPVLTGQWRDFITVATERLDEIKNRKVVKKSPRKRVLA